MNDKKNLNEQKNDYADNKTTSTLSSFSVNKKNRQRSLRFKFDDNRLVKA